MKLSLRTRLLGSFLVVIVTCGAVTTVVGVRMIGDGIIKQAQEKVRLDLNSARLAYRRALGDVREAVDHTAVRFFIREGLSGSKIDNLSAELDKIRRRDGLDILTLTDARGTVLLRAHNPAVKGGSQANNKLIKKALTAKEVVACTEIVAREELLKEGNSLAERACLRLVPTPRAKPAPATESTSGMMIMAAAPVLSDRGQLLGLLYGGKLLNRDFELVDEVRDTVYSGEMYAGKHVGTATIFQGDVRISTNVMTAEAKRAIGTRVSAEVHERVLNQEQLWVERAFVVNDWYVTAYEPIRNTSGEVIGILYVGMLERKFTDMKRNAVWAFVGISLGGIALSVAICYFLSRSLTRPAHALMLAAQRLADGNLKQRVQPDDSTEEIGMLGRAFNFMAASIEDRDEQLRQRAQQEIMKSERLAMIGRLAAGVAHEINNPLGGILLFSRLLLRKAPAGNIDRENLERIAKEAERCQNIVQRLLEFARQTEPQTESMDLNHIVEKTTALLENQALFHNIEIVKRLHPDLPPVCVDASQMQQVFVNIIVNATEAIEGKGVLTISTSAARDGRVEASFTDTGHGISEEDLKRLFEPFFTTKGVGQGTGLGLSISHGIVKRHGGTLSVRSRVGAGATFVVSLPQAQEKS
ncbi:MAG: cache domain-containing protein [Phycisphaerae bacterium]|nr:cache domain-containing protein [Phycisphaerae bacterium]